MPKISGKLDGGHPQGGAKCKWGRLKSGIFNQYRDYHYISETMQERDRVKTEG